ncbi:4'-phosphopantetheinyl transferase family protein [Streptomyces morookaense]|uniref:4'-phosphopantetheinyl transferase superfamily protein n=1 Tax=Streptomyces morookaense TaxID=1970 RepID=A0A7Y7B565_STRMO|nr:4'-phosphopantetheinyl transferase superfamily protein [Streptomyces morookaense]NVK79205.1 4'-phosphopantetheinyl transferase superfamily protein [Streptomyces morookaense]GHF27766.1 hypothetical protein GCM10010359_32650 [Streptomyces morookaense]
MAVRPARDAVAVLRLHGGEQDAALLHPAERVLAPAESSARRRDFLGGRSAAALALQLLGRPGPVLRVGRRPLFPPGVLGSLSHSRGIVAACLVTTRADVAGAGVDVELTGRLTPATADLVCTASERASLPQGPEGERSLTVIFSAKEAFYKATGSLGLPRPPVFHDLEVTSCVPGAGTLLLRTADGLLPDGHTAHGQVRSLGPYVWTTVLVLRGSAASAASTAAGSRAS